MASFGLRLIRRLHAAIPLSPVPSRHAETSSAAAVMLKTNSAAATHEMMRYTRAPPLNLPRLCSHKLKLWHITNDLLARLNRERRSAAAPQACQAPWRQKRKRI